jgi:hypothetical protein
MFELLRINSMKLLFPYLGEPIDAIKTLIHKYIEAFLFVITVNPVKHLV